MGICASGQDGGTYDDNRISRMIDNHNAEHQQTETLVKKLLLLGAGESGKSTLFKQIFQLYGEGYSEGDRYGDFALCCIITRNYDECESGGRQRGTGDGGYFSAHELTMRERASQTGKRWRGHEANVRASPELECRLQLRGICVVLFLLPTIRPLSFPKVVFLANAFFWY